MGTADWLRNLYHYKVRTFLGLVRQGEFGYLLGVIMEKLSGENIYLIYLRNRGYPLTIEKEIHGHTMTLDLTDPGLSRYLISRGVNEPKATQEFIDTLRGTIADHPGDDLVVLDIGANIGYFALLEAREVGERGTVYAFEPAPKNRELLERNVSQNGYEDRIKVRPSAIGDREGSAELLLSDHSNWHKIAEKSTASGEESIQVDTQRVDSFLSSEAIPADRVVGIRMDVEGYESAIFEGMTEFFEADTPAVLFVEIHPSELTDAEMDRLISRIQSSGFTIQFAGQDRDTYDIGSPEALKAIGGSHIRLILQRF